MKQFLDKNPFFKSTLWVLLAIYALSVAVRYPMLNRNLSKHHEFCTAHAMRIFDVWNSSSIWDYKALPVMNYEGPENKWINNDASNTGKIHDEKGNYYYVSHPPLAYYLPYAFMHLPGMQVSVLHLQSFNLLLGFFSALFVYMIVQLLCIQHGRGKPFMPAVIAFAVYCFNPAVLWFQSNVYMSDTAIQFFFAACVYTLLKLWIRGRFYQFKYLFFYSLLIFLINYTSWLGVFFSLVVLAYSLNKVRKERRHWNIIFATLFFSALAWAVTIYQYSGIAGLNALFAEWNNRLVTRSGLIDGEQFTGTVKNYSWYVYRLLFNYLTSYTVIFVVIGIIIWRMFARKKSRIVFTLSGYRFLILSGLPVLGMHILLLNYSVHDFTTLYGSILICTVVGVFYDKMKFTRLYAKGLLNYMIYAAIGMMVAQYYFINFPKNEGGTNRKKFVESLVEKTPAGKTLFVNPEVRINTIDVFNAKRNLANDYSIDRAIELLNEQKNKGAVYHETKVNDDFYQITRSIPIELTE